MGSDDFFKKRKKERQDRKHHTREPKPNSYLIVTEGAKTEPYYFEGLADHINAKFGKGIIVEKPELNIIGEGKCTVSLVESAMKILNRVPILYENVWIVFDKDDFHDFDEAIEKAKISEFKVAWTNQSFEYWIYLHFEYSDSALHRSEWVKKLNSIFTERVPHSEGYEKNEKNLFNYVTKYGSLKFAISNAKRIESKYHKADRFSDRDPCTSVHHLILDLSRYLEDLMW